MAILWSPPPRNSSVRPFQRSTRAARRSDPARQTSCTGCPASLPGSSTGSWQRARRCWCPKPERLQPLIELTYRGQIRRLRGLAKAALPIWRLRDAEIRYLYHGENTTFRIDHGSDRFMMRLARPGYHTPQQLDSEGQWLRSLYGAGFGVPEPIAHPNGYLLPLAAPGVPERQVLLFRWVDGWFRAKVAAELRGPHRSTACRVACPCPNF
jgi:hypothetical protein